MTAAALAEGQAPPVAQYPAESGHWYSPVTGKQVELPPRTWTKTALGKNLVPGVTTILRVAAKGYGLERYEGDRFIDCTVEEIANWQHSAIDSDELPEADEIRELVWEAVQVKKDAIFGRGKELHAAIEDFAKENLIDEKWSLHLVALRQALETHGINITSGNPEHTFATDRFGGKVDWHNDEWLIDFKTKDRLYVDGKLKKPLAYPEHAQQLAAYAIGLSPIGVFDHRCANVFVGVEDAAVHVHEWQPEELEQGWREFDALCSYWWIKNKKQ